MLLNRGTIGWMYELIIFCGLLIISGSLPGRLISHKVSMTSSLLLALLLVHTSLLVTASSSSSVYNSPIYLEENDEIVVGEVSNTCTITDTEMCPISDMPKGVSTQVFPGSNTRCIFSYSTPYSFQVIPGDTNKLLYYFQGGGISIII